MLEKYDVIKLSDGNEYIILDIIKYNENKYVYLSSVDGITAFKINQVTDKNTFINVKNEQDMINILKIFQNNLLNY